MTPEIQAASDNNERLREIILDLEQSRAREAALRRQSDALLAGLQALVGSDDIEDGFAKLLSVFKGALGLEGAFVLDLPRDGEELKAAFVSEAAFARICAPCEGSFARCLRGRPVILSQVADAPEWASLPPAAAQRIRSAIMTPLLGRWRRAILVGVSATPGRFGAHDRALMERLAPLARQALFGLEQREELSTSLRRIGVLVNSAPYGLLTIEPGLTIGPQHSETISGLLGLDDATIAGADVVDLFDDAIDMSADALGRLREALDVIVDADVLNWELNRQHLPGELRVAGPEERVLEALWTPMISPQTDRVAFVLLSLRDRTDERAIAARLESEEREHKERMGALSRLLKQPRRQIGAFFREAEQRVAWLDEALATTTASKCKRANELHTLKGAARALGFSEISSPLHALEDRLLSQPSGGALGAEAAALWSEARGSFGLLRKVYRDVLLGEEEASCTISAIAEPHLTSARAALAAEGIACACHVADAVGPLTPAVAEALSISLQHLIVNVVDHSILPARRRDRRVSAEIALSLLTDGDRVVARLSDDGGGFDYEKIRRRAEAAGLLSGRDMSLDVLFEPGFTTADHLDERSGRGVGMYAVRTAVLEAGGAITLQNRSDGGSLIEMRFPIESDAVGEAAIKSAKKEKLRAKPKALNTEPKNFSASF